MELQTEVDPSIEGGFIFDINDFRLDASIATQLKKVKQQFIDKNRRIVWFTIWQFAIYYLALWRVSCKRSKAVYDSFLQKVK